MLLDGCRKVNTPFLGMASVYSVGISPGTSSRSLCIDCATYYRLHPLGTLIVRPSVEGYPQTGSGGCIEYYVVLVYAAVLSAACATILLGCMVMARCNKADQIH